MQQVLLCIFHVELGILLHISLGILLLPEISPEELTWVDTASIALIVNPETNGIARITCAKIIPNGVNNQSVKPRGPRFEISKNTNSPITTGGKPIPVLIINLMTLLNNDFLLTTSKAKGMPNKTAITKAVPLTCIVNTIISKISFHNNLNYFLASIFN